MRIFILACLVFVVFVGCSREEVGGRLPVVGWLEYEPAWLEASDETYIRVLIGTSGFEGLVHERVEITGTGAFYVRGGGSEQRFSAGEVFRARGSHHVAVANPNDRLVIVGLGRNWVGGAYPRYRGTFDITRVDGGFTIVNELPLEEYLYAVLPSEMPSFFGVEASMVQAVTARSFALHQMQQNRFREFGAHVDDSVMSQVYNNIPENEVSIEAVRATSGLVLMYNGEIALANYFSTSGGTTANFGEVWANGAEFPAYTPRFLRAGAQFLASAPHPGDLRTEEAAAAFFRSTDIPAFDREFPWFRWHVTMTTDELSERINQNLAARRDVNPALVYVSGNRATIGELQNLRVTRRGQGGNIMEMIFYGDKANAVVQTEFNIRTLLNPREIPVMRHDGTTSGRLSLLPSAFFTMEIHRCAKSDRLESVTFYGGGNGHGVGKSQNGVRALLDLGMTYVEIIHHFYPGVELISAWQTQQ
ncbi:MAG: SpoIID/LytB domain-containing protein [Defluviitaleaceae bacterium]|nr:SpoIID/LytB domain-containing protein [Defluviitaleaceae bacterium]